jgi:hypothetical protein
MRGIAAMRAAEMSCIKVSDAVAHDETLCKQYLFSPLMNRRGTFFHVLHVLLKDARPMTIWLKQQVSSVGYTSDILAILEATPSTPPQIDIYTCKNKKARAKAVRKGPERACSPPVLPWLLDVSPVKKALLHSSRIFVAYHSLKYLHLIRDHLGRNHNSSSRMLGRSIKIYCFTGRNNRMNTRQKLDHSSPIVQRVFRLRERMVRNDSDTGKDFIHPGMHSVSSDTAQARKSYPWQMWQKSDFSAYAGGVSEHRCKE